MRSLKHIHCKPLCLLLTLGLVTMGFADDAQHPQATVPWRAAKPEGGKPTVILRAGDDEVARVWLSYDAQKLYLRYQVTDASPLQNNGDEPQMLFKTGDSVDLQLGLNPDANPDRTQPVEGDLRLMMTVTKGKPIAVLYRYKVAGTSTPVRFWSPVSEVMVDRVDILKEAAMATAIRKDGYDFDAAIPWSALAGKAYAPPAGKSLAGDVGVLFSDPDGAVTVERIYWANKDTSVVADVPSEIRLHPNAWGRLTFAAPVMLQPKAEPKAEQTRRAPRKPTTGRRSGLS